MCFAAGSSESAKCLLVAVVAYSGHTSEMTLVCSVWMLLMHYQIKQRNTNQSVGLERDSNVCENKQRDM